MWQMGNILSGQDSTVRRRNLFLRNMPKTTLVHRPGFGFMTSRRLLCLALPTFVLALTTLASDSPPPQVTRPAAHRRAENARSAERQREGTKLTEVSGRFEFAGDRVTFHPANEREHYRVLENLALERVGQVLGETRAKHEWTISGVLTEYRGVNYLLLQKAVIRPAAENR